MSRLARKPVPAGKVDVSVAQGTLTAKGAKGTLTRRLHPSIAITIEEGQISVAAKNKSRLARALTGTFVAHVKNMVHGVETPFEKKLILDGVGYKVALEGSELVLQVGFSHPVSLTVPEGVDVKVEKNVIALTSIDKEALGQFAANVRRVKPPEPYLGKGIHYEGEVIRRKQGKKSV